MSTGENNQILTCFITNAIHFCGKHMYYFMKEHHNLYIPRFCLEFDQLNMPTVS